ncbi:MAG: trypsin-like peptidase domain-containing protein [Planctomycetaceae bacterium]|nr:trypsin-like peptidase domain-containing protein [Planctomycetaceae bacterium]
MSTFPIESLLLTVVRITTKQGETVLTNATGFFFERDGRVFLVTNRHVIVDEPTEHHPDSLDLALHVSEGNIAEIVSVNIPLFEGGKPIWREATDSGGLIDVVAVALSPDQLPETTVYRAFTSDHLVEELDEVEVGTSLLVVGFPLGFHDTLHHLPVARQAVIASSFGMRFQGTGCFLTDARTHRGISGAPVVARFSDRRGRSSLPYLLLGIHASRIDMTTRDQEQDEALGLNCAWYSDVLGTLTEDPPQDIPSPEPSPEDTVSSAPSTTPAPIAASPVPAPSKSSESPATT